MATLKDADDIRWQAVIAKDKDADGQFFFSVRTTGVYCRPSCPARPARRENVAFHRSCDAAEAAGFRACKRCRPREASQSERDAEMVAQGVTRARLPAQRHRPAGSWTWRNIP